MKQRPDPYASMFIGAALIGFAWGAIIGAAIATIILL